MNNRKKINLHNFVGEQSCDKADYRLRKGIETPYIVYFEKSSSQTGTILADRPQKKVILRKSNKKSVSFSSTHNSSFSESVQLKSALKIS